MWPSRTKCFFSLFVFCLCRVVQQYILSLCYLILFSCELRGKMAVEQRIYCKITWEWATEDMGLNMTVSSGNVNPLVIYPRALSCSSHSLFCSAPDRDTTMSAKVNMEVAPKEPDPTPLDQSTSPPSDDVLISGSDGVAKKARPQPHTTTAFLLQGELRSKHVSTSV